jgi:hypothetical protein
MIVQAIKVTRAFIWASDSKISSAGMSATKGWRLDRVMRGSMFSFSPAHAAGSRRRRMYGPFLALIERWMQSEAASQRCPMRCF